MKSTDNRRMTFKIRRSKEPISEINVTPFVDVMLVLLIIFMVTAPLLTVGVQVDLPETCGESGIPKSICQKNVEKMVSIKLTYQKNYKVLQNP